MNILDEYINKHKHKIEIVINKTGKTLKEQYEFFYLKLLELTNTLISKFDQVDNLEFKIEFSQKIVEFKNYSRTWCFCDYDAIIKEMNESEKPYYIGIFEKRWKMYQNNSLQPNEVIISCVNVLNKSTTNIKFIVDINYS